AIALAPGNPTVARNDAEALAAVGRYSDAVRALRSVLPSNPDDANLLESLAWILATSPDALVRDGKAAVDLARHAAELTIGSVPGVLDTLAAAYAESGRFSDAVSTAERALAIARSQRSEL